MRRSVQCFIVMALGAPSQRVLGTVLARAAKQLALGVVAGYDRGDCTRAPRFARPADGGAPKRVAIEFPAYGSYSFIGGKP